MSNFRYRAYELKPLNRQKLLKDFCVFDIETTNCPDDTHNMDKQDAKSFQMFYDQ